MSNYRTGYGFDAAAFPGGRALTPKQRRRMEKKANRDLRHGATENAGAVYPGNPNPPAPLSGHPRRRRDQIEGRRILAEDRAIARALRKLERAA